MTKKIPSLLTKTVLRLWPLFLIGTIALCAASLPRTINLFKTISTDPVDLLPPNYPNVQSLLKVREKLEKGVRTSFVFESEDPIKTVELLKDTVKKLRGHPLVGKVIDRKIGYDFFNEHKLMYLELEDLRTIRDRVDRRIQQEKLRGLYIDLEAEEGDAEEGDDEFSFKDLEEKYRGRYSEESTSEYNISKDGKIYAIFVESKPGSSGLSQASKFQDAMEEFVKTLTPQAYHPTMKVYFSGASKVLEYRALMRDLKKVGLISGVLLFIPLLIRFRNPFHVAVIFAPLALAMPISFAASSFFVPRLNVSTSFLFAILGGLGIENGIHIFSRYYETRLKDGKDRNHALHEIFAHTGRAILTSVASVAVTFLLLLINDFRGFSDFGLIAGLGLWIIFAVYFTFFPSLLIFLEKIRLLRIRHRPQEQERTFKVKPAWLTASLGLFLLFSVYSFASVPFLQFEFNSKKIRADIPEVRIAKEKQRMTTRRVNNPAAVVIYDRKEATALREKIDQTIEEDKLSPTIDTSRSYYDLVPPDQTEKMRAIREIEKLLADKTIKLVKGEQKKDLDRFKEALAESNPVEEREIPEEVAEIFKGKPEVPGELFYINAIPDLELDDGRNAMRFADDVEMVQTELGTYHPSSDAVVYGIVLKTMLRDSKKVLLISLLTVTFFVFIDFRNWKKTSIVMLSIVVGVFWLLGIMLIFGIKFNFYNMIIIPAVMGMSIDNSIHIYHRYEELGRGSLAKVLSSTGIASMLASLTNASGFLGLLFCTHRGLYSIGLLAVIGVATCLISTLVFLPALLQFLEHIRYGRKAVMP
jgi:predicted RND superfamily exporter protein